MNFLRKKDKNGMTINRYRDVETNKPLAMGITLSANESRPMDLTGHFTKIRILIRIKTMENIRSIL
jgi:hypothetical protein